MVAVSDWSNALFLTIEHVQFIDLNIRISFNNSLQHSQLHYGWTTLDSSDVYARALHCMDMEPLAGPETHKSKTRPRTLTVLTDCEARLTPTREIFCWLSGLGFNF